MTVDKAAKNLLLDKSCFNCFSAVLEKDAACGDQINTCWLHADDVPNNYHEDFPSGLTCEYWENEDWPDGIAKLKKSFYNE